jgi:hypothetical protein
MVESVKVIESTKIFRSPLLNNLKIFNNLKPLKLDTKPGPSRCAYSCAYYSELVPTSMRAAVVAIHSLSCNVLPSEHCATSILFNHSSTKDMTTIRKSKRLKLSLKYILVPIAIILRTTSAVKMAVKIKLKTLKVSSTQTGWAGYLSRAKVNVLAMIIKMMKASK